MRPSILHHNLVAPTGILMSCLLCAPLFGLLHQGQNSISSDRRVALLVANENYAASGRPILTTPIRNADGLQEELDGMGFKVTRPTPSLNASDMTKAIEDFAR